MSGADEWTTVRRRRNVVNVAEQAKALKRLPIPVVPLSFSALDVEENAIQKAQEAAEAEKKRLRKERQRAKAAEQAQAAHKEQQQQQQQQQRASMAKPASGSAAKAPSDSTPQPSGSTRDSSTAGPYSGLLALLATIFGVSLIQQLIQQIKSLLGLGSSRPSKRRKQGPPGSQRVAGGSQHKEPAKDDAQTQSTAPVTPAGATAAGAPAAKDKVAAAMTAQAAQPSRPAQGGAATLSGAAEGACSGPAGSNVPAAAGTAGAAKEPAAPQAAAQPSRNTKPASSEAARPPAPTPSKPPCDADWARGRFLVSEHSNAHADVISSLALSGDVALSSGYDGSIKVWHWPANGPTEHTRNLTGHSGRVEAVALETSATPRLAASSGRDSTLKVWDLGKETSIAAASYYVYESVRCMAVDWTAGSAALGCQSGSVALFDLERGRKLQAVKGAHSDEVCCLLHHSYGGAEQQLISGSRDACVAVWDLRSNPATSIAELEGLRGRVCSLAATDHLLYVGDYSSTVKVFDLRLGSQPQPAFCLPNVPVFAGDACPVAGLHCDGAAGVVVSSSIGWWTANKQALEEAPQDANEPKACLNVHATCKPGSAPASGTTSAIPKHEYLYTLCLCTGIATCLVASPGFGSGGARMLMGTSNGTLVGLSLVKGSGNRMQVPDGMALEEGLPIGVEQLPDEDEDSDDDDEM